MNADKRQKDIITHGRASSMSISIFALVPFASEPLGGDADRPRCVPKCAVDCLTEKNPELEKKQIFYNRQ